MSKDEIILQAIEYAKRLFYGNSDEHDFQHTLRVFRNTQLIMESYPKADRFIVSLAA